MTRRKLLILTDKVTSFIQVVGNKQKVLTECTSVNPRDYIWVRDLYK